MVYGKEGSELITNVVFDIGRVLVRSYWKEYMGIKGRSKETQNKIKNLTLNSELWQQIDLGMISLEEMIAVAKEKQPNLKKELSEFSKAYSEFTIVDKEVEQFLINLKAEHYHIYLLSNYGKEFFEELEKKANFFAYIDGKVIAYEVNIKKPNMEIFHLLIEKYNIKPEDSVFIEDNKKNIDAAKKMKFHTIRFRNIEQVKSDFTQLLKCGDCCSMTAKSSLAKPKTYARN